MLGYIISNKEEINVEEHEIKSFDILHKTELNIFVIENNKVVYTNNIILNASENGHIQVLEWYKNSGYEFKYNNEAIFFASSNGHIQVLEWFKNSGHEFKYNEWAINIASQNGHIEVLDWFKNSGYEFKYNKDGFDRVSLRGNVQILKWFKNFGYKFKYDNSTIRYYNRHFKVLEFYSKNINIKKLIKWSSNIFIKTIKFKTNHKYLKGYQKN